VLLTSALNEKISKLHCSTPFVNRFDDCSPIM
jgi:hypothetical protein